ncbi:MAG: hypothetical protein ABI970_06100 [Chloroflexota bacterium]
MSADCSAVAASAADGSAKSAAALLAVPLQRMNGSDPPKAQKRRQKRHTFSPRKFI